MFSHVTISIKIFLMTEIIQYYTKKNKIKGGREYIPLRWYWLNQKKKKKKGTEIGLFISFEVFALSQKIIWNENIHYGLPLG